MMVRFWIVWILMSLAATQARGNTKIEIEAGFDLAQSWNQLATTVTKTVKQWWEEWTGQPGQKPAAPTKVAGQPKPGQVPARRPSQTAPMAQAPSPRPPQVAAQAPATAPQAPAAKPKTTLKDLQAVRDQLKNKTLMKVAQPGRAGTSQLARTKAQVPVVNWQALKVTKNIPRLDIGMETLVSREEFELNGVSWDVEAPREMKPMPRPQALNEAEFRKLLGSPIAKVAGPRGLQAAIRTVGQPLAKEEVDKVQWLIKEIAEYQPLPYKPLSDEQMKMMAALILFDKGGHCHFVMGLFHQLSAAEKTRSEATYHLGACASQLDMHQAAFFNLSKLISAEDKEYGPQALQVLAKKLPPVYEMDFYRMLRRVNNLPALVTKEAHDDVYYRIAKGAYRNGALKTTLGYSAQVSEKSEYNDDNRFLSAMASFALGEKPLALKKLQDLWASIETRNMATSNIRALTSVNLARMYFAQKQYDKALEHYMKVPKDHALWVQALIEQGWTQLALEDFSGAIGNMYSLHSPYFKAVYQPESFVVRTIGYLNICQYGDAYKSLSFLEKDYRTWSERLNEYLKTKTGPQDVYNTVKNYVRGKSTDNVDGVPFQVWRELARRKDFLNQQTALNDKQDEVRRYEGVNEKIKAEKAGIRAQAEQAKKRFDHYLAQIKKNQGDRSQIAKVDVWKTNLKDEKEATMGYRYKLMILEQSRAGYLDFQAKSQSVVDSETQILTARTAEMLQKRAEGMKEEMRLVLDNNEFLRYEVFAGSGENIRYQVSGGEVTGANRIPASIKPTKMMNWSFDGEFWEDEIGSYRSGLHNSCPKTENTALHKEEE